LRSFDRIPLTQQIKDQQTNSGIDAVKADVALGLDLNGLDSFSNEGFAVSSLGTGDSLDDARRQTGKAQAGVAAPATNKTGLGEVFGWDEGTDNKTKHEAVNQTLSAFTDAGTKGTVKSSVAQHGMMTGTNVFDEVWNGDPKEAVKNFVSEEVYIHTKVSYH
jgi:hypothetical protein